MLVPRKEAHRKVFKGRIKGQAQVGNSIVYGAYGLQSLNANRITGRQIEAARQAMTRKIKRQGRVWIRIFPHTPVTRKPNEVRMGKGKGNPEFHVAKVKPGTIMFEISSIAEPLAREAMRLASNKLPVKTKFIKKQIL